MEKIVLGSPQHNGVAGHMSRTLTKRAISLYLQLGLSKQL